MFKRLFCKHKYKIFCEGVTKSDGLIYTCMICKNCEKLKFKFQEKYERFNKKGVYSIFWISKKSKKEFKSYCYQIIEKNY